MATIGEMAKYIRSKNAGPFWLTVDIFCKDQLAFQQIRDAKSIAPDRIAKLYAVNPEHVKIFPLEALNLIKISFPRYTVQGSRNERDMHGGQQYIDLLDLEV